MDPEPERWVGVEELITESPAYLKTWRRQSSWHLQKPGISSLWLEPMFDLTEHQGRFHVDIEQDIMTDLYA